MSKRVFRFFIDFIDGQQKWLNSMSDRGYRLQACDKVSYMFEECKPNEYEYTVEYVGDRSFSDANDYRQYFEDLGYRTFTKNINLNFSIGKARWRPYSKSNAQIATSPGRYNKELLIIEKRKDSKPFELHTNVQDQNSIFKSLRNTYTYATLLLFALLAVTFVPGVTSLSLGLTWALRIIVGVLGLVYLSLTRVYSVLVRKTEEEKQIFD